MRVYNKLIENPEFDEAIYELKTDSFIIQIPIYRTFVFCLQTIKMHLSLKLNHFLQKSEPILPNELLRILYPFRSPFTKTT